MRVHVIRSILRVVFDYEDQSIVAIGATRYFVHEQSERIIVVRHLFGKGVHAINRRTEAAEVIVHNSIELQGGQVAMSDKLVKLPLPSLEAPEIGEFLVIATEEPVGNVLERGFRRERNNRAAKWRSMQRIVGRRRDKCRISRRERVAG